MSNEAHIIVGCGGSGIKTLKRLNRLLSQDSYWRHRLDNEIYYVVVDTDLDEMREFEQSVHRDLAGVPDRPFITVVPLSQGKTHLHPLVHRHFVEPFRDGQNLKGRDRLLEHWWHEDPAQPFVAPTITNVTKGAGQCPPVSYFLTWHILKEMEDKFTRLIQEIMVRQGGLGAGHVVNFLIVSGLAGGTGRGSWELIAFKLRELFQNYNWAPTPRAFLFDSSLFDDVYQAHPEQKTPMRANALTGISQLSCWITNKVAGHRNRTAYLYQLPSLTNPERPEADVLKVTLNLDPNQSAPVNHAYLVFKENARSFLRGHGQYCDMVGAGIYAALSKSSIDRQAINSTFPYVGLATSTFEVNAGTIGNYFEAQARVRAVRMLMEVNQDQVQAKVEEFFKNSGLQVDVTDQDPYTFFQPESKGRLLQKVLARLDAKSANRLSGVRRALEEDNVEETRRRVRGAVSANEELVRACFDEVLADEDQEPVSRAEQLAVALFDETRSAANVEVFIEKLQAALEEELAEMPAEMPWGRDEPLPLVEEFATRQFPYLLMPRFDEAERKKLMEVSRNGILKANYPALKQVLQQHYQRWSRQLDRLRANAADLRACYQKLDRKFANERDRTVAEHEDAFQHLFTDPDKPEDGLGERFGTGQFYLRQLKPVLAPGEDLELLGQHIRFTQELFDVTRGGLLQPRDFSASEQFDVQKRRAAQLEQTIRQSAGLHDDFLIDNFSIRRVISGLIPVWRQRLQRAATRAERNHLEERFAEFFGFRPQGRTDVDGLEYDFPEVDDFILHMAASLAKTCKPYWMLHDDRGSQFKVTLFIPTARERASAQMYVQNIIGDDKVVAEVYPELERAGDSTQNPFILVAYSTQGVDRLDNIRSLNYYTEPGVLDLIRDTEDPQGKTIYSGSRNGGIGYIDPLYVRNETIRQLRWRPWAQLDDQEEIAEQEAQQTADALLYALFPGDSTMPKRLKEVQGQLHTLGWPMPLIRNRGRNHYVLTRLPLVWDNDAARSDLLTSDLPGWDADKPVASHAGLSNVWQVLNGDGNGEGSGNKSQWRERILLESQVFWNTVLPKLNIAAGLPAYREMLQKYCEWLAGKRRRLSEDDANRVVWEKLLQRAHELLGP